MSTFKLPALPYDVHTLTPSISDQTLATHHGKHLAGYINNLNALIEGTDYQKMPLEEIIQTAEGGIFNNAAQTWNHIFYFEGLAPKGKTGVKTDYKLYEAIVASFGSFDQFKEEMLKAATTLFGSGWAWLIVNANNQLEIVQTFNADTPIRTKQKAIFTIDVWEHAYYLDYKNLRGSYVNKIWDILNWQVLEERYLK